jgi:beta-N-acetylhexosaminidase
MDLRTLGNLFMVGFQAQEFTPELRDLLDDLSPGGVILFSRNFHDPGQIARLNHDLQSHARKQSPQGLLIGVDQEAGRVRRLLEPFSQFPPALHMARSHAPEAAVREFAEVTARELRLVGFNVNFVPVLDVLTSPNTPETSVIGDRSFGPDPQTVARLGATVIGGMRAAGVISCSKHFPGHGGTAVDSHVSLPVDLRPSHKIAERDLVPFKMAMSLEVEMVMTAHVLYRSLDPAFPATLSERVIGKLLRDEMGYGGVVITDDMDMGAVSTSYSLEECAVRSLRAGADVLLICHSVDKAVSARSAIHDALKHGEIPRERIQEALSRIRKLKFLYRDSLQPCDGAQVDRYFSGR